MNVLTILQFVQKTQNEMSKTILVILLALFSTLSYAGGVIVGAKRMDLYLNMLKGQKVGLIINQTSMLGEVHLMDTLINLGINVQSVFSLEHGFRGKIGAGEHVKNDIDEKTRIPIISLYGTNKKPKPAHLKDVDVVVFDIQDVGARFYTYISTMHYVMEACAENGVKFIILDRPNPNGDYVDGPVLRQEYSSFVGMHPIPIVHGCTVGELAQMINGEKWLQGGIKCDITVIPVKNYTHTTPYTPPIKPSPNLPNYLSIRLYPSLCLFEGTPLSIARGTPYPFQAIGYPDENFGTFEFTPKSIESMAKKPPFQDQKCYGKDFRAMHHSPKFTLKYLIEFYHKFEEKDHYFNSFFRKLAGSDELQQQIKAGFSEDEIRVSWIEPLAYYKQIRKKYTLYPDFE